MSEKTLLVIADVYSLSRIGKKFTDKIEQAQIKHKGHLVDRSYADEMNNNWQITGKKFVIDEEASIEAQEVREAKAVTRKKIDDARELAARAVTSMALGINRAGKDETPDTNEEIVAAFAEYKELNNGVAAHPRTGLKKLNGMIDELINKN